MIARFRALGLVGLCLAAAACSPNTSSVDTDPAAAAPSYLDGVETDYTHRIEKLDSEQQLSPDTVMRNALIAGDGEIFVTSAMFTQGAYFALDLIVLNHGAEPLELSRKEFLLVDSAGNWLTPVEDFDGAGSRGLRGLRDQEERSTASFLYESPDLLASSNGNAPFLGQDERAKGTSLPRSGAARPRGGNLTWRGFKGSDAVTPNAPPTLSVEPDQGRPYWAYWRSEDAPQFPVTAFIMLGDRHMVFEFDQLP